MRIASSPRLEAPLVADAPIDSIVDPVVLDPLTARVTALAPFQRAPAIFVAFPHANHSTVNSTMRMVSFHFNMHS